MTLEPDSDGRIVYHGQRVQITAVGLERGLTIAKEVGDAFAHRDPFGVTPAFAQDVLTNPEIHPREVRLEALKSEVMGYFRACRECNERCVAASAITTPRGTTRNV